MYIVMKNVNNLIMAQVGTTYQMELSRLFEGDEPTDIFKITYYDAESDICDRCGEPMSEDHECGDYATMTEAEVESIIIKEFNEAEAGRVLIINRGEFEDSDEGIIVEKK